MVYRHNAILTFYFEHVIISVYSVGFKRKHSGVVEDFFFLHHNFKDLLLSISISVSHTHSHPQGPRSNSCFGESLTVLGEIRASVCGGVICSLAGGAHFLVRGHWGAGRCSSVWKSAR